MLPLYSKTAVWMFVKSKYPCCLHITMNSLRPSLAFFRFSCYNLPLSMRMVGVPFRYLRVLGNLLAMILSSRVAPPYITMAVSGFQGSSNSVAISAAIEPMVIAEIIDATAEMIAPY